MLLTKRSTGDVWSYPNLHGDITAATDAAGAKQGITSLYDPFGSGLTVVVDNSAGNWDYGWEGQHTKGLEHTPGIQPTIEMGARVYNPSLGRFQAQDPVSYTHLTLPTNREV